LKRIAEISGGEFDATVARILQPDDRTARQPLPLWPYLLMAALGMFVVDVALRRIELAR
jgi:Ca-activated chloride channel family protein